MAIGSIGSYNSTESWSPAPAESESSQEAPEPDQSTAAEEAAETPAVGQNDELDLSNEAQDHNNAGDAAQSPEESNPGAEAAESGEVMAQANEVPDFAANDWGKGEFENQASPANAVGAQAGAAQNPSNRGFNQDMPPDLRNDGQVAPETCKAPMSGRLPKRETAPASPPGSGQLPANFSEKLPKPLRHLADKFQQAGKKYKIDPRFLAAISMLETGKGTSNAFRNKNNAMGVSNSRGPIRFKDPAESIERMARSLSNPKGYYRNARSISQIGRIYAPPGARNDPHGTNGYWPSGVSKYFRALGGDPSKPVILR